MIKPRGSKLTWSNPISYVAWDFVIWLDIMKIFFDIEKMLA